MRIDVLNGVNLSLLGRRDQGTYGVQSIEALATEIYTWARDLDLQVRCRQTNHDSPIDATPPSAPASAPSVAHSAARVDATVPVVAKRSW